MATSLNQDDYIKTALRLPRDLHAKIQEAASTAERSMNAEIVARLQASFLESMSSFGIGEREVIATVTDVALNVLRAMDRQEFEYYLDRVKRANLERMGVPPENMPEPPLVPDLKTKK